MAFSPISGLGSVFRGSFKTLKKVFGKKFGRKVRVHVVSKPHLPAARQFFGRKALAEFKVNHTSGTTPLQLSTQPRLTFSEASMDRLTVDEFDRELSGYKDKATRKIRMQLAMLHELNTKGDYPALQQQMLELKELVEQYLTHGESIHAGGEAWRVKKGVMESLTDLLDEQLPDKVLLRAGLSFKSQEAFVTLMENKLMGEEQEHIAQQLAELEPEESIRFLKDFQNVAHTGRFDDSPIRARSFAEAYAKGLSIRECITLLSSFKVTPSKDHRMMQRQVTAIVASCVLGRVEGADGNIRQARLLHHEYRDGVLDMNSCRSKSHEIVTTTSMALDTPEGQQMVREVDKNTVGDTCAFRAHPTMKRTLEEPSSFTRTGQIIWMNCLLKVARDDEQLKEFVLIYDQVYHETGAKWLQDYENTTPKDKRVYKDIDHPAVIAEAEKLTPGTLIEIKDSPSRAARIELYEHLSWPYPPVLAHPSYPFIEALEMHYPVN